jgi:hypothetical protein
MSMLTPTRYFVHNPRVFPTVMPTTPWVQSIGMKNNEEIKLVEYLFVMSYCYDVVYDVAYDSCSVFGVTSSSLMSFGSVWVGACMSCG